MHLSQPQREGFLGTLRRIICRLLRCDPQPHPQPRPKDNPIAFEPGKVIIMAEYPPGLELTPREIRDRVAARLAALKLDRPLNVNLAPERVIVLRSPQRTLATITGDVPAARQSPLLLLNFVSQLHHAIALPQLVPPRPSDGGPVEVRDSPYNKPDADSDPSQPPDAGSPAPDQAPAMLTAATPTRPSSADAQGFDLRAASPNWLSSGAPYIGGGGPGAWPIGIASVTPNATGLQPWDFVVPSSFQSPEQNPLPVEVAILDTVPDFLALESAYGTWVGNGPALPPLRDPNPLLTTLLAGPSGGPFNVVDQSGTTAVGSADQIDVLYQTGIIPVNLFQHPYPMASHGLFIAGIIRSLAPQAKLRLIQVLNDDGGGSAESILQGLTLADRPGRSVPLVINCSLVLNIPRPNDPTSSDLQGVDQPTIDSLTQGMHDIFAWANQSSNVVIVAAAGNTGSGGSHPLARFPAALQDVAGVAALKQDDNDSSTPPAITDYSDQADDQADEGLAAFGGETDSTITPLTASSATGMLGVFIDPYPVPSAPPNTSNWTPNTSGWARWAGTSFAAPIVSAALANLIGRGTSPFGAIQQLRSRTPADPQIGNVIELRQGS